MHCNTCLPSHPRRRSARGSASANSRWAFVPAVADCAASRACAINPPRCGGPLSDVPLDADEEDDVMDMSTESILVILVVGIVAGWLAGKVVRGAGFRLLGDLVVGIVGAFIASWLFPRLGIHLGTGIISAILYSALGAIILLLVVRLIRGRGSV